MVRTRRTGMSALTTATGGKWPRYCYFEPGLRKRGLVTDRAIEAWYHSFIAMNDPQPEGRMASHIERRRFLATLGGAAAWPVVARAQQPGKTPRVGYIRAGTLDNDPYREEFVRGMHDLGYVEGRNIAYEFR